MNKFNIDLSAFFESFPGALYCRNVEGVYLGCNQHMAALIGLDDPADMMGKTDRELNWRTQFEFPASFDEKKPVELTKKNSDGEIKTYRFSETVLKGDQSETVGFLGLLRDISERKKHEAEIQHKLKMSTLYLKNIINNLPEPIYWADTNNIILGCNLAEAKLFGFESSEEMVGKNMRDLAAIVGFDKEVIDRLIENNKAVMHDRKAQHLEETMLFPSENVVRTYHSHKAPFFDDSGNVIGMIGTTIDITQRKAMEEELKKEKERAEAASRAKTEFIANMSHDVKTPLSGIISISEALSSRLDEEYRDLAVDIFQSGKHLMAFFENCIELSKLESRSVGVSKKVFSLKQLINEIFCLFHPAVSVKGLEFTVDYDKRIPSALLGDRVMLYRIILNLVGNAIKFTETGGVTIRAKLIDQVHASEKVTVELTITDTGIGIPTEKKDTIFERFTRLTPSYQGTYEGSGIGLYIAQEFIKLMGGDIFVESKEGEGSRFTLLLPLQIPLLAEEEYDDEAIDFSSPAGNHLEPLLSDALMQQEKPIVTQKKEELVSLDKKSSDKKLSPHAHKILLVEDSSIIQKGIVLLFDALGCTTEIANNGEEAMQLFEPGRYVLVLMDVGLPDMKGYDVAKLLKERESGTAFSVPILGLSAHATDSEKQLSLAAGMSEMLTKPLLMHQAKAALARYVDVARPSSDKHVLKAEDGLSILDLQSGAVPSDKDEKVAWMVLGEVMTALPETRAELEDAYQARDIPSLTAKLHQLHGDLTYTKAPHLLHQVSTFESALRKGEYDQLDAQYAGVVHAMDLLEKAYRSL